MRKLETGLLALVIAGAVMGQAAQAADATFDLAAARRVIDAGLAEARRLGAPGGAIAVVDAGGHPILVERLDGTFAAGTTISIGKARTAAIFNRPTKGMEDAINNGRTAMTVIQTVVDAVPLQGGVPLTIEGRLVGGVGVSGAASAAQDEEIAIVAAKALAGSAATAMREEHYDAAAVKAAFAKGNPLLENGAFKIHASRRDGPGIAEVHTMDTDIFYLLEGEATVVLGGRVIDPKTTAPGEIRGARIEGGEPHPVKKGDVLVIPAGMPHWFQSIKGPVLYYTVKVTGDAR